jgi:hypothetical protein
VTTDDAPRATKPTAPPFARRGGGRKRGERRRCA